MIKSPKFIVVVGASAGGLDALAEMVGSLQKDLDVAYCVVLHLSRKGIGDYVVHRLSSATQMRCSMAKNGAALRKNNIYVARPNQHLLVKDNKILLGSGPEENRFRPSIDVLFRSAAVEFNTHAIGIILSGMLNDGTSGMGSIKRSGGACIAQDPNEAEYPDMSLSVINNISIEHVVSLKEMGQLINNIIEKKKGKKKKKAPADIIAESKIAETVAVGIGIMEALAKEKSEFACPDCGGNLWEMKDDVVKRYRCHIGHAYTESDLVVKHSETASATLWIALRMMEERKHLLKKMAAENIKKGYKSQASSNEKRESEMGLHIENLKKILFDLQNQNTD